MSGLFQLIGEALNSSKAKAEAAARAREEEAKSQKNQELLNNSLKVALVVGSLFGAAFAGGGRSDDDY